MESFTEKKNEQREKLKAGELKLGTHFTSHDFQSRDGFEEKFKRFLDSLISIPFSHTLANVIM